MKKYIIFAGALLIAPQIWSQELEPTDAIRFGSNQLNGSARYNAMSGAFGAIGGDVSAIQDNAAGSAVFNYNNVSFGANISSRKNNASFLNYNSSKKNTALDFSHFGAIFVVDGKEDSKIKNYNFGLIINNQATYDNNYRIQGINNQSIGNYFLQHANFGNNGSPVPLDLVQTMQGETIGDLYDYLNSQPNGFQAQQAMLGYQGYILNNDPNGSYSLNVAPGKYYQETLMNTSGFNSKLTGNFGLNIDNKYYLGANLNVSFIDFNKSISTFEENTATVTNGVGTILFDNNIYTYGSGFSFNIGGIAKLTENARVGLSYESPTWYGLNDESQQRLQTYNYENGVRSLHDVNPNLVTLFDRYRIKTPSTFGASFAYIFGKSGIISVDYKIKDFSTTKYSSDTSNFSDLNNYYSHNLKSSSEVRIGGEYRISQVSLRAGYRYVQSPYKQTNIIGDVNSVSGGIGYSFGAARLDFGYSYTHQPMSMNMISSGLNDYATVKTKHNNFALTYSFSF